MEVEIITQFLSLHKARQLLDCSFQQLNGWKGTLLVTIKEKQPYELRWTPLDDPNPYNGYKTVWFIVNNNSYWLRIIPGQTHVCSSSCEWFTQIGHIVHNPDFRKGIITMTFERNEKNARGAIPFEKQYYIYKQ